VSRRPSIRQAVIEDALREHAGVREAAVVHDGRGGLLAFVVPDDAYLDEVLGRGIAAATILGKWRKVSDLSQLTKEAASAPVGFNTIGWNSSYTRQPIPAEAIQEWVETTVADILQLAPKAMYEIGCGTGMLLMRIAPHCDRYVAVDFSPVVLDRVRKQLRAVPSAAERVEVRERRADNFDNIAENSFDTLVLNSVVQYFPNSAYLTKVLENAIKVVKPPGHVYIGDIRSLPLLPAFSCSVELFQAADEIGAEELRDRIRRRIEREAELVLSPAYFLSLRHRVPHGTFTKISRVEIRPLRGHANNEMSRYRYQAIIHVGHQTAPSFRNEFLHWNEREWTLEGIRSALRQHPNERLGIQGIRNARIEKDVAALEIIKNAEATRTVGEIRRGLEQNTEKGLLPQDLLDLETESLGFKVFLSWAGCQPDGSYDALFIPVDSLQGTILPAIDWPVPHASAFVRFANAPGQGKLRNELIDRLLTHCRQKLPEELVPRDIVLVDTLMRTGDGDIDPSALVSARSASSLP
jgi:SAM-dependent methyltransferase